MGYRFLVVVLLLLAIVLNLHGVSTSPPIKGARVVVQVVFSPLQKIWQGSLLKISGTFSFIIRVRNLEKENSDLRSELKLVKTQFKSRMVLQSENERLRRNLGFVSRRPYRFKLLPAQVIGREINSWNSCIIIDRGLREGVKPGMNVINEDGLVGRVSESSLHTSKIILIIDPGSAVSCLLLKSRTYGMLKGGEGSRLKLKYVPEGISIEAGEKIIVSSASRAFIPGLPVGEVSYAKGHIEDLFQTVKVKTAVDFSKLDVVYLCKY